MPTKEEVRQALRNVLDPEIGKPIEDVGMLKDIVVDNGVVRVYVLLTIAGCPLKDRINSDVTDAVRPILDPGQHVEVVLGEMTNEQRQGLVSKLRGGGGEAPERQVFFTEGNTTVIAVASGKGGVGKSSVTANLAAALAAEGNRVGIIDVDVWGFSIPRMMGVSGRPVAFNNMIMPLESHGVRIISMGFFVPEETPVIWRGPMLHKAVNQFLGDVYWGDLDFLLADLPPGTGDVSISMAGFLPGAQMLVVTTPQEAWGHREHVVLRLFPLRGEDGDIRRRRRTARGRHPGGAPSRADPPHAGDPRRRRRWHADRPFSTRLPRRSGAHRSGSEAGQGVQDTGEEAPRADGRSPLGRC